MKKNVAILSVLLALCLLLSACGGAKTAATAAPAAGTPAAQTAAPATAAPEKTFKLKLAGIKSDDDPASVAMHTFADEVNANSNGTIEVTVYTNSVLGGINDLLSGMTDGTVDMAYNTLSCYSWLSGCEVFNAVSAPFLWKDNAELEAFLASDACVKWMNDCADASGVRVLMAKGELPPRELTSNKPIYTAADFKGLKIRTAESTLVQSTMRKLGAEPVVVPFADLYMALRNGTADAQENNFMTDKSASFYEVQKYVMQTDYIRDVSAIFISNDVWNQMSDNQKAVMTAAAEKAVRTEESLIAEQIDSVVAFLKENMTWVDVDVNSIRDALGEDFYYDFDSQGTIWPTGTMDVIFAFKNAYQG